MNLLESLHGIVHGDVHNFISKLAHGVWDLFSVMNGNPDLGNYGLRFGISIFFALNLLVVLQLRTKLTLDVKHLVAFVGGVFLLVRYVCMMGFEWGWQIGLYDDWVIHFLFPPLEHFFYGLFFICMGYYSLNAYNYYPGILRRIIPYIPAGIICYFVWATMAWKEFFLSRLPAVSAYREGSSDWLSHALIATLCFYCVMVAIKQYKRYYCFLSAFWTLAFLEHFIRAIAFYNNYEPSELATIFHAMATWSLPLLTLHFTNAYVLRLGEVRERRKLWEAPCVDCPKPENQKELYL
jgi:hypothetical protein